jgi:phosphoribosylglycinamide formyltransferase-1
MRFAVLVSGSGTNLQALLDAAAAGQLAPATIAVVGSNRPGVRALERAAAANVPAVVVDHRAYGADRGAFEDALLAALAPFSVEAVVLAGFMRVLTPRFLDRFPARIVNTHPSLLPAFAGAHAARDAIAYGAKLTGVTIHFVDATLDGGPIIAQRAVPIRPDDDEAALQRRIQAEEHRLLPRVVRALAQGRLACEGRNVVVTGADADADQLV